MEVEEDTTFRLLIFHPVDGRSIKNLYRFLSCPFNPHSPTLPLPPSSLQLVEMVVDLCSGGSMDEGLLHAHHAHSQSSPPTHPDAHTCRVAARLPGEGRILNAHGVLEVGGLAHPPPAHLHHDLSRPRRLQPHFRGCIRNLRVNRQVCEREFAEVPPTN